MLLAIDVGNTHSVYGLWDGSKWLATWRRGTNPHETEDQIAVWLKGSFDLAGAPFRVDRVMCASVVPPIDDLIEKLCDKWLHAPVAFVRTGMEVGLDVCYEPPTAVGADRVANAIAALAKHAPPIIVVDFGTATTFDCIDRDSVYVGGAILPGVQISSEALAEKTAKLPQIEFKAPDHGIGRNTVESLQSGIMLGYAGAIDSLARRIDRELGGGSKIIATGGLGQAFFGLCETIGSYDHFLTLDGLVLAAERIPV
jgi:type III pantothenate kinase